MDTQTNPMGTDGFAFLEYTSPNPQKLAQDFKHLGFVKVAKHHSQAISLYQQGTIYFFLNNQPDNLAARFAKEHGAGVCAMGFRIRDAQHAFDRAVELGAKPYPEKASNGQLRFPAIYGVGGSLIYFVDQAGFASVCAKDFKFKTSAETPPGFGLTYIDHVTHNLHRGEMDKWAEFYERLFNFREIRYFDIKGQLTGLVSRAMTSPCGKLRIPLNESTDDHSQIEEFLRDFNGEGIQHIALGTDDIYHTIEAMRQHKIVFLETPDTYYEMVQERVPWHSEDLSRLRQDRILLDGTKTPAGGLLLQIFTATMLGPVFFEIIQRKGNEGFGEGNFKALFESIELDQIRRGVLRKK